MRLLLQRIAAASPLVPALAYTATAWIANVIATVAPAQLALLLPALLLWFVSGLLFIVLVVWFRDDDWLAAGFLLGVTLLLSAWTGDLLAEVITQRSLGPALLRAPGMLLGVIVRAVISVPLLGGGVALLRWITRLLRPARPVRRAQRAAPDVPRG